MAYAVDLELGPNSRDFLWEVIQAVDIKYIGLVNEKIKASTTKPGK